MAECRWGCMGSKVLWTLVERHVQPQKKRAHPMYKYSGVGDPTQEKAKEQDVDVVTEWVGALISSRLTISAKSPTTLRTHFWRPSL